MSTQIRALFTDIGGVLLTNGWDREARKRACAEFGVDCDEMDERHSLTFGTYEEGKLTLDEYLTRTVFYRDRPFSLRQFKDFILAQSLPHPDVIELLGGLKKRYGLKTAAVSNEGRELTIYRIERFGLSEIIDFFVSSCFVHFRKPDPDIFRLALDMAQVAPEHVVYIEDRPMFAEIAAGMGIRSIVHASYEATRSALADLGLSLDDPA